MKAHTQADERRDLNAKDQFGRPWLLQIEHKTFEPVGLIHPAGWTDPLNTPQQYLRQERDDMGQPMLARLRVDMERWMEDQRRALREWRTNLWAIGRQMHKNLFNPKTAEQDEYLVSMAGPKPFPSADVIRRAAKGDRKLLGLEPLDRETRALLGLTTLEDMDEEAATAPARSSRAPKAAAAATGA